MRLLAVLLVWLMGQVALAGGAADVVAAALADARKLPPELRKEVRYLSLHNLPEADRPGFLRALAFHVNSLSREAELVVPTGVSPDLLRVSFIDHGWKREVWEKLAPVEPYFHLLEQRVVKEVEIKAPVAVPTPAPAVLPEPFAEIYVDAPGGGIRKVPRSAVQPGEWVYVRRNPGDSLQAMKGLPPLSVPEVPRPPPAPPRPKATPVGLLRNAALHAPWLGKPEVIAELATLLDSEVPIVRADWFLYRTSQQVGRGGAGYYDFLGLSSRKDAEELAGLDVKTAQRVRREMAALVDDSGVALNNRQVVWYATVAGSWWETL
ncbi:MAG TPA: hypothetical protein VEI97_09100, partial [bacterium]|nr:hypothetical protein [bacterium]